MPRTTISRNRESAHLAPISQLAEVVLELLDDLLDGRRDLEPIDRVHRYQLQRLASFFDSARRGSLEDVSELAEEHAKSSSARSTGANRAQTRPPSLDDDYVSWKVVKEHASTTQATELVSRGAKFVDGLLTADASCLANEFTSETLLPFLDRLAHADEKALAEPVEGWHSLHR